MPRRDVPHRSPTAHTRVLTASLLVALACAAPSLAQGVRWDHRVAVSTTSLDTEREVEASLERNVNLLGAAGYEVTAIVGGQGPVLDQLLERKPYVAGRVDHGGHALVVMAKPDGRSAPAHSYRLLHTRALVGVAPIVASLGEGGYHLVATATEGQYFHAAFERTGAPRVEYRHYANRGRTSWMTLLQRDADALGRLVRVVPMGLDHALVELGPARTEPGAVEWVSVRAHEFASAEARLRPRTDAGYRVQLVRIRVNEVDVLLVRPAGPATQTSVDLEDAPWAMPCTRGTIVGADVYSDGDTYCAVERSEPAASNRGLDLRIRPEELAGGRLLFDVPGCEAQAQMGGARAAVRRLVVATQLERALFTRTPNGYRVTRALAAADARGDRRLTVFTTQHAAPPAEPMAPVPAPRLQADRDELLLGTSDRLEDALTSALAAEPFLQDALLWVEVPPGADRRVRLAGCVRTSVDKALAASVLDRLLVRTPIGGTPVRNDVVVDPWR